VEMSRLLVLAVLALVGVALADAIRSRGRTAEEAAPTAPAQLDQTDQSATRDLGARLAELGATGVLTYSDRDSGCELRALALPDLTPAAAPRTPSCRFALSPDRKRVLFDGGWRAVGRLGFRCGGGADAVDVVSAGGSSLYSLGARCAAAWSSDGRLAVVGEDGEIRTWQFPCGPPASCSEVLLPKARLRAVVGSAYRQLAAPPRVDETKVLALAWLSPRRLAVSLEVRWRFGAGAGPEAARDERFLAAFEAERLVFVRPEIGAGGFSELVASPRGGFVAVATERPAGFLVVTSAGGQVPLPSLPGAHALAWSPDERLLALATRASVYVLAVGDPAARVVRLPIAAGDVSWLD
jgi:hypothetical protein